MSTEYDGIVDIQQFLDKGYEEVDIKEKYPSKTNSNYTFPQDKWKILEHRYKSMQNKQYWDVCSYDIFKYDENNNEYEPYMIFGRNYHTLSNDCLIYTKQNEKEFLITSSDYQFLTILNLTDGIIKSYCYGNYTTGNGFCPVSIEYYDNEKNENTLKVYGCFWGAPYETLVINNVDLNDLSESYNISNTNIKIIEDTFNEIDPRSLIDDYLLEKIEQKEDISDLEMNVSIELINTDELDQIPIQFKEEFKVLILKALLYYYDNH